MLTRRFIKYSNFLPLQKWYFVGSFIRYKRNRIDEKRLKYIGAGRVAAEWVLLNGGEIKYNDSKTWMTSFWDIPRELMSDDFVLKQVKCDNSTVTSIGFRHIKNIPTLSYISANNCYYVDDTAISNFMSSVSSNSLKTVELSNTSISPSGLYYLAECQSLKRLDISNCRKVDYSHDRADSLDYLRSCLPNCQIITRRQPSK